MCDLQDVKRWLRAHGASAAAELSYYVDSVRSLFSSSSRDEYVNTLISLMPKWSKPFSEWFKDNIHPVIDAIGAWQLEPFHLSSITTNSSESFNFVLKKIQDWREAPVDAMVLSLFRLAQYHIAEIRRCRCNVGNFVLRDDVQPVTGASPAPVSYTHLTLPTNREV